MKRVAPGAGDAAALSKDCEEWRRRIARRARRANLEIQANALAQHAFYLALLNAWNSRMNLTSLHDRDDAVDRLILEPVSAARFLHDARSLLDLGSGGGSPAIPLKIQLPQASLTMVESKIRKGAFLREAARRLSLEQVRVESRRFEELLTDVAAHESSDVVSIRAVRIQASTLSAAQAFLRPGGRVALFRGPGEDAPPAIPTLVVEAEEPLVETLRSRMLILRKTSVR